jgi:hypothetical protein
VTQYTHTHTHTHTHTGDSVNTRTHTYWWLSTHSHAGDSVHTHTGDSIHIQILVTQYTYPYWWLSTQTNTGDSVCSHTGESVHTLLTQYTHTYWWLSILIHTGELVHTHTQTRKLVTQYTHIQVTQYTTILVTQYKNTHILVTQYTRAYWWLSTHTYAHTYYWVSTHKHTHTHTHTHTGDSVQTHAHTGDSVPTHITFFEIRVTLGRSFPCCMTGTSDAFRLPSFARCMSQSAHCSSAWWPWLYSLICTSNLFSPCDIASSPCYDCIYRHLLAYLFVCLPACSVVLRSAACANTTLRHILWSTSAAFSLSSESYPFIFTAFFVIFLSFRITIFDFFLFKFYLTRKFSQISTLLAQSIDFLYSASLFTFNSLQ